MSVVEDRFENLWKLIGHPNDNREYAHDWFVNGWLSVQQVAEADRVGRSDDGETYRMKASRNRGYATFYRQKAIELKALVKKLEDAAQQANESDVEVDEELEPLPSPPESSSVF